MKRKLTLPTVLFLSLAILVPAQAGTTQGSKITVETQTQLEPPTNNFVCRGSSATLRVKTGTIEYLSSFNVTVQNSLGETLRYASASASSSTSTLTLSWSICTFDVYYRGTSDNYRLAVSFYDAGGLGRSETLQIPVNFAAVRSKETVKQELQSACAYLGGFDVNWQLNMTSKAKLPKTKLTIKGKVFRAAFLVTNTKIQIRTAPPGFAGKIIATQTVGSNGLINITFDSKMSKYGLYYLVLPARNTAIRGYLPSGGFNGEAVSMILGRKNGYLTLPKVAKDSVPSISSSCSNLMNEYSQFS
ncbi:MAG: hypothetical protein RLZZ426_625 [Actinomycetota bacterium]